MAEPTDVNRELVQLESELRRLELEYNMYFAGRLPRPPWESRARVAATIKRIDRLHISNYAERFRFSTLQSRFRTFVELWDRGLRAREEGRPGPFSRQQSPPATKPPSAGEPSNRVVHVAAFQNPQQEETKLRELYDRLAEARRESGEQAVPFDKFAALVRDQVQRFRQDGSPEVAFRVAVRDGKVNFTARALKGTDQEGRKED